MNAKQRRLRRRLFDPVVAYMARGFEEVADAMERDGTTMTPAECRQLAKGLREMARGNQDWDRVALGKPLP